MTTPDIWLSIIILGVMLVFIAAQSILAGQAVPQLPDLAETITTQEENHAETNHQTHLAGNQGGIPMDANPHLAQKPRNHLAPVDSLAQYTYGALDRAMTPRANQQGEVQGHGPAWACLRYGTLGHDYNTCSDCFANFYSRPRATP